MLEASEDPAKPALLFADCADNPLLVLILDALVDFLRTVRVQATKRRKARGETLDEVVEQHSDLATVPDDAGGSIRKWRSATPWNGSAREYVRLRVSLR